MRHETKTGRKLLSVLLALAMVIGLLPGMSLTAHAEVGDYVPEADSLTFTAQTAGSSVTLNAKYGSNFKYSTNGVNWTDYTLGTTITLENVGDYVRFRGNDTEFNDNNHVSMTGQVACSGNVMSLRLDDDGKDQGLSDNCFQYMFAGCESLTTAPELPAKTLATNCYFSMFKDCTNLTTAPELPAETLARYCYAYMFRGCDRLTTAPKLPAKTLADYCYYYMFYECKKLNAVTCLATNISSALDPTRRWLEDVAPTGAFTMAAGMTGWETDNTSGIPRGWNKGTAVTGVTLNPSTAQTVAVDGSVALTAAVAPEDAADNTVKWSVGGTNAGAVKLYSDQTCNTEVTLGTATETLTVYVKGISAGEATVTATSNADSTKTASCTVTVTAAAATDVNPEEDFLTFTAQTANSSVTLKVASGSNLQYNKNGEGWKEYTLGMQIQLENKDDYVRFRGKNTEFNDNNHVSMTGQVACSGNVMSLRLDDDGKDQGLSDNCFQYMFDGCTSLTTAPELPAKTLAQGCYQSMFKGCTSLTTAPKLPAETLAVGCYSYMFSGCTSLTTAPKLPAKTLAEGCYYFMFLDCTSLNAVTCLATNIYADGATVNWLNNVASTGTFTMAAGMADWSIDSVDGIPSGWTAKDYVPDPIPYLTWDNDQKKLVEMTGDNACKDYTVVTESTLPVGAEGQETWYVVKDEVTINQQIDVDWTKGSIHLILCDNAKLTLNYGISSYTSFYIYAQSEGDSMGELIVNGGNGWNGFGLDVEEGDLTINGGSVSCKVQQTGIFLSTGTLTVNGGSVTAESDDANGFDANDVTINGGTVNASGRSAGLYSYSGSVKINGGSVTATGGSSAINADSVTNAMAGTGWTDTAGTEGETAIPVSTEGQSLIEYKKVQFTAAEAADTHTHSFTYGAEGAVLTATCTDTVGTCGLTDSKVTLTIAAPTLTTYGGTGSAEATLEGWEAFNTATGQSATATDIRYQGREETSYGESATAPTAPGKYTAKITVAGATASVNYEIGKATPTVDDFTFTAHDPIYDGSPKAASVEVKDGVNGMGNVTVQYYSDDQRTIPATPTDAGTYYVGVTTGSGSNYNAMESALHGENWQFTIIQAQAAAEDFDFIPPDATTYDGTVKTATVTPKNGVVGMGQVTVKYYSDADHTQSVENPTNAGTYYVVATVAEGDNYYPPMLGVSDPSWYFTIDKADPNAGDFTYTAPANLTYDGTAKSAAVTAKNGVTGMGDVTVNYYSDAQRTIPATPTDVGTYYVGITVAEGTNYNATDTDLHNEDWWFTIGKTNPAAKNFTFTPPADLTYDGTAKSASVTVKNGVNGMGPVTVKYYSDANCTTEANPVNVGTYYVGVTVEGGSNYNAASVVISDPNWHFSIAKAAPKAEHFTCSTPTDLVYDGTKKSVTIAVKDGVVGMGEAWVNYYYDTNFSGGADPINAGIYFFGIRTLPGANYDAAEIDLRDAGWWISIAKADPNAGHFNYTGPANLTYDGSAKSATVTVKDDVYGMGDVTVQYYSDAQRTIPATPTDAGTYYVGVSVSEGDNYKAALVYDADWQFTISKIAPVADDFDYATPSDLTYDGSAKSATVTAKEGVNGMGDVTVKYYSDAACENEAEPTDAGTYYVGITVAQGKNYNATDTDLRDPSWSFTVVRLDPTADDFAFATPTDLTYDGNAKSATVTVKDGVNGMGDVTVNYYSDAQRTTPATPTDAGTYYVGITVAEGKNYNATDTDLHNEGWQFTIAKADIHPTVSMKNWTEGYRASEPVTEGVPQEADVLFTYARRSSENFTDRRPSAAGRYVVKATVAATANYNGAEITAEFIIYEDDSADLTVTSPLTTVTRVTLNGVVVSPANYTVSGGSVYFTESFLATLKPGNSYTIKVTDSNNKTATATYRVGANGVTERTVLSATTGDPGVVLYAALAVSATLGLGYMGKKRKED